VGLTILPNTWKGQQGVDWNDGQVTTRQRWARGSALLALWCLPALVLTLPKGLLPFGLLLLASSLMVPGLMLASAREHARPVAVLAAVAAFALAVAAFSSWRLGLEPGQLDSRDRLLFLPWVVVWTLVMRPPRHVLWWGAVVGVVLAAALAVSQILGGAVRASGWGNAIVFADVIVLLLVLVVLCRPPGRGMWMLVALGLGLGLLALVLSGTRGTWPGAVLVVGLAILGCGWRSRRRRLGLLAAAAVGTAALVVAVPGLTERMRLSELQSDIARIESGDNESSAGARLERLKVAAQAFAEHPWTGVGFGHFDLAMQQLPDCRHDQPPPRCKLGHAHNDLAEWAATMGVPGAVSLLALYGVPLLMFLGLRRRRPRPGLRDSASVGLVLVTVFVMCGLTQSMFAHQTTTSIYAALTGILLGMALLEARPRGPVPAPARAP
jgi:O-antigen ligase